MARLLKLLFVIPDQNIYTTILPIMFRYERDRKSRLLVLIPDISYTTVEPQTATGHLLVHERA